MAAKKVPAARRPMGKIAGLFRCFPFLSSLFYLGSTISGIGSWIERMEKMENGNNIMYSDLTQQDTEEVFNFFRDKSLHGVHRPSFYTVSSLIDLYGSISCAVRIDKGLRAVSINLSTLEKGIYIYVFAVKNNSQRQGIGRMFFTCQARLFGSLGYNNVLLRVLKSNNAAYQFWRAMGFLEVPDRSDNTNDEFSEYCMEFIL